MKPGTDRNQPPDDAPRDVLVQRLRHLVGAQPALFGLSLVLLLWFGLNLPGLGKHGLWDPWEMDRAHVARQMTAPPRVFVLEAREPGQSLGPIARWLDLRYQSLVLATPEVDARRGARPSPAKERERALQRIDEDIFHVIIVDAAWIVQDPGSHADVEELVVWLERVRARNPGTAIFLLQALPLADGGRELPTDEWATALRETYAMVRVELAGRELNGRSWGKPGAFRRDLISALKGASAKEYAPFAGLAAPSQGTFLEQGFWRAAEQKGLDRRMVHLVSSDIAAGLVGLPGFQLNEPIFPWPRGSDFEGVLADFAEGTQDARPEAVEAVAALEAAIDEQYDTPWLRAQFKRDGHARSVPPLDYWLMALSFSRLGFSELASRLPGFLLGLLGLIVLFRAVRRTWGSIAATLAGVVLATSPLYFAQARSVAGEMGWTVGLILIVSGLFGATRSPDGEEQHRPVADMLGGPIWLILVGAAMTFLSMGLFGLIVPTAIGAAYLLVARDRRAAAVVPVLLLGLLLAGAWQLVHSGAGWTFWSHFDLDAPLFAWSVDATSRPVHMNFDVLVRQIGFGAAPWSVLLPFALGGLVLDLVRRSSLRDLGPRVTSGALVLLLWFVVPYVVQSMVLKHDNYLVFPAAPAIAVAVGVLLHRTLRGAGMGTIVGVAGAILLGLLLSNAGKSPEPLTTFLTTDPPLVGHGEDATYPEAQKLPRVLKVALALVAVLLLLHAARLGSRIRRVVVFFTRRRPFWVAFTLLAAGLSALLLYLLQGQIAAGFNTPTGQTLEPVHRLYVRSVFYWRPVSWALLGVCGVAGLAFLGYHTRVLHLGWRWLRRWLLTPVVARTVALLSALGCLGGVVAAAAQDPALAEALELQRRTGFHFLGWLVGGSLIIANIRGERIVAFVTLAALGAIAAALTGAGLTLPLIAGLLPIGFLLLRGLRTLLRSPGQGPTLHIGWVGAVAGLLLLFGPTDTIGPLMARALLLGGLGAALLSPWLRGRVGGEGILSRWAAPFAGSAATAVSVVVALCAVAAPFGIFGLATAFPLLLVTLPLAFGLHRETPHGRALIALAVLGAGLAVGLFFGRKLPFLVPAIALVVGAMLAADSTERAQVLGALRSLVRALREPLVGAPLTLALGLLSVGLVSQTLVVSEFAIASALWDSPAMWILLALCVGVGRVRPVLACAPAGVAAALASVHLVALAGGPFRAIGFPYALPPEVGAELLTAMTGLGLAMLALAVGANLCVGRLRRDTPAFDGVHAALLVALLALALELLFELGTMPGHGFIAWANHELYGFGDPGHFVGWATWQSPAVVAAALAGVGWLLLCVAGRWFPEIAFPETSLFRGLRRIATERLEIVGATAVVAFGLGACFAQLYNESGLTMVDLLILADPRPATAFLARNRGHFAGGIVVAAALVGLNMLWGRMRRSAAMAYTVFLAGGLTVTIVMCSSLVRKWVQLQPALVAPGQESVLVYVFLLATVTLALYVGLALLCTVQGLSRLPRWLARLRTPRASAEGLILSALGFGLTWALISFEVAQAWTLPVLLLGVNPLAGSIRAILTWLRRPRVSVQAGLLAACGAVAAVLWSPVGLALLFGAGLAVAASALARDPAPVRSTPALLRRGIGHTLLGGAAVVAPLILLDLVSGTPGAILERLIAGTTMLVLLLLVVWIAVVLLRLGLGVADLIGRLALVAPAAYGATAVFVLTTLAAGPLGLDGRGPLVALALAGAVVAVVGINQVARWIHPLRMLELVERPRVFVPLLAITVAAFTLLYNQKLVVALSFHLSQKHILETVSEAEGGDVPEGVLFQHGLGGGGGSKRNFYTSAIPEVKDAASALRALAGQKDELLTLMVSGSSAPDYRLARGFSAENDADGDGVRDHPADAGLATGVDQAAQWLEDSGKSWVPNEWVGSVLIDSEGWTYPIVGNSNTRVQYDLTAADAPAHITARGSRKGPAFDAFPSGRNRYTIDSPEAADHKATSMTRERIYFLLPKIGNHPPAYSDKGSFSDLNHQFRKLSAGSHLGVLDDRSSRILLATSHLRDGEEDHNWLRDAVVPEEEFLAMVRAGRVEGAVKAEPLAGIINWEDSLQLLGWRVDPPTVSKGKKFRLFLYFRVVKQLPNSLKIFVHCDLSGHRIHTDHWPLAISQGKEGKHCIGCFQTNHWRPGDIVVDEYEREVPYGAPSGETEIWLGLFNPNGDARLKIVSWNDKVVRYGGSDNRARIGSFVVR